MVFHLSDIVLILICFQSILFAFILISNHGPKKGSNRLLALFLIVLCTQMAFILAQLFFPAKSEILPWMCIFGFAYGPILYLYSRSLMYQSFSFQAKHLLHFLPVMGIIIGGLLAFQPCQRIGNLLYVSLLLYLFFLVSELIKYRGLIKNTRSSNHRIDLQWLQWMIMVFSLTLFADIVEHFLPFSLSISGIPLIFFVILFLVNGMFYKGLKQPYIFLGITQDDQRLIRELETGHWENPVKTVPEISEQIQQELKHIRHHVNTYRPYSNSELTLKDLAEQLEMPPKRLSFLINNYLHQNFMGFINAYRIKYAQERLANPKDAQETVQEVMYESGFNSKSSFNTLFKQKTGLTPSEYKDKHQQTPR